MNTQRDELRGTISNTICNAMLYPPRAVPYLLGGDMSEVLDKTADAILAAGYRKPQQVTTAMALEEVPKGTLVLAANGEVWRKYTHKWDNLDETGDLIYPPHHIALPATVLHVGGNES